MENQKVVHNMSINEENWTLSDEELDKVPGGLGPVRITEASGCPGSNHVSYESCKDCERFGMSADGDVYFCMGV